MDALKSIKSKSNNIITIINSCIKNASYTCMHVHVRHVNHVELNSIFTIVLNMNNHELNMNIVRSIYNYKSRQTFLSLYLDKLLKSIDHSDTYSSDTIKMCKDVIPLCSIESLKVVVKNIINTISVNQLTQLISMFDIKWQFLKDLTIYGSLDVIKFMTETPANYYSDDIIIEFIIDLLNSNDKIDFNKLKWIIQNYKDSLNNNLLHIISNINNFSENNNSYIIIDYLFFLMKITYQEIYKIFKKIIYNGNTLLFSYLSIKYFSTVSNFNYFEYACLFSNPNSDFNNNLIGLAYIKTQLSVDKLDDIFKKICKYKIISSIKWFITFLPERYKINDNIPVIIESGNITPIISPFYMEKKCKYTQNKDSSECCVCLENKQSMIQLNCHTSHIICSECLETAFKIKQFCPLCRGEINISECIIHL
jgi:hypothetical protein